MQEGRNQLAAQVTSVENAAPLGAVTPRAHSAALQLHAPSADAAPPLQQPFQQRPAP